MNNIQILGNMTKDCELKYAQSGTAIGSFGIAVNKKIKNQSGGYDDKAMFFDVTAFGKTAENINKFFGKGSRILISGELDFQQWEKDGQKRSKVGIVCQQFDFIDRKGDAQQETQPMRQSAPQPTPQPTSNVPEIDINEDEIPF